MKLLFRSVYNLKRRSLLYINNQCFLFFSTSTIGSMKFLNVAEKNDAAKNIAMHLSRGTSRRREGLSPYNKIYEFEADVNGQKAEMVMTSVSGHLLALEFVGSYKHWQSCSPLALFDAPVFKYCPENYEKIKKTLEREVQKCHRLIIWTDCDREGENIGFEIIQVCTAVKSNLQVYRAKFSEITSVSVRRALQNLEQPNKNISDAVDVRQELDLRIGAAFTRFQTMRLQKVFPSRLADSLVSYGSCQFPTLGFVVERYRAVENFVAEQFWKIKVNHTINELSVDFNWERVRLFDQQACQVLHDICLESPRATVCEVKTKPKSKWRPLPLDTVELEKSASRKLKINAKETMRLAEKLYTQGLISYPRTETNEYPKEMNLAQLVGLQTRDPNWGSFAQGILDSGGPTPRQGNKSDKAHPPIHPTKYTDSLSGNEQRLYEFIVRSFLACCAKDAQGQETAVAVAVAGERFAAAGLMVTARNYLDVYPYDKWSSKEIHVYQTGQTFDPSSIDMVEGSTQPPHLLTEADLIALMEKHGIGTDATHAEHIETIKSRSYVALAEARFVPGLLGMGLVEGYDAVGLPVARPHLRAALEADLRAVSAAAKRPQLVLAEQIAKYKEVYLTVAAEARKLDAALAARFAEPPAPCPAADASPADMPSALKCPKCGAEMTVRRKRSAADEFYIGCLAYPACRRAVWLPALVSAVRVLPEACPTCGPNYRKLVFEWRNNSISHLYPPPYTGCLGGCDTALLDLLNVSLASVQRSAPGGAAPRSPRTTAQVQPLRQHRDPPDPHNQRRNQILQGQPRQIAPPPANRGQNRLPTALPTPSTGDGDDNNVICACNQPAIMLTVRKQNANFGKQFYKCSIGKENGGCDFFLWGPGTQAAAPPAMPATSATSASSAASAAGWGPTPSSSRDSFPANDEDVTCECGLPCKKITVHKDGPNKGRAFYGCPKDFNSRCNFFQWADGAGASAGGAGGAARGGRGVGRGGGGAPAAAGAGRRCGRCRQPGHTRARCPNQDQ